MGWALLLAYSVVHGAIQSGPSDGASFDAGEPATPEPVGNCRQRSPIREGQ
jgi:hypothetical protein